MHHTFIADLGMESKSQNMSASRSWRQSMDMHFSNMLFLFNLQSAKVVTCSVHSMHVVQCQLAQRQSRTCSVHSMLIFLSSPAACIACTLVLLSLHSAKVVICSMHIMAHRSCSACKASMLSRAACTGQTPFLFSLQCAIICKRYMRKMISEICETPFTHGP